MEPRTLSASAIKTFQDCEAMYKTHYVDRVREGSGAPAELGTAVHDTCEWAVAITNMSCTLEDLYKKFAAECARYGLDKTMVKDGRKMLKEWFERWHDSPPHEVLSCELKESFPIKSRDGLHTVGVTYIWDRGDRHEDGSIEVVDYKTWRKMVDADDMLRLEQVRIYALSAQLKYKDDKPAAIWVTLDQMRTGPVSVKFSRDANLATWNWLRDVYQRILESDGSRETINENCRYCARKAGCQTLDRANSAGNISWLRQNPDKAALKLAELKAGRNAVDSTISELEEFMEVLLEEHDVPELAFPGVVVKMRVSKRRSAQYLLIDRALSEANQPGLEKHNLASVDAVIEGAQAAGNFDLVAAIKQYIDTSVTGKASASLKKPV